MQTGRGVHARQQNFQRGQQQMPIRGGSGYMSGGFARTQYNGQSRNLRQNRFAGVRNSNQDYQPTTGRFNGNCFHCGQMGHREKRCPNKNIQDNLVESSHTNYQTFVPTQQHYQVSDLEEGLAHTYCFINDECSVNSAIYVWGQKSISFRGFELLKAHDKVLCLTVCETVTITLDGAIQGGALGQ